MFRCFRSFSPSVGDRDPVPACPRFPAGEDALTCAHTHTRTPAPQQLFVFCLHLFTHPAQGVDRLHNKGEGLGVKTGTFRAKSGDHRPITPLFSTALPSPRKKITFTRLFSASKLENGHLAQGKASVARKRRPYTIVIQALNQHKRLSKLSRCAAPFSAFASAFSPHRTAQNTTAAASKGCEGKNAKVFTPNAQWHKKLHKVGEGVKAKNKKWRRRARTRARERRLSQRAASRKKHVPLSTAEAHREGNGKWRTENGELISPRLCW